MTALEMLGINEEFKWVMYVIFAYSFPDAGKLVSKPRL